MNELIRLTLKRLPDNFKNLPWKKCYNIMRVRLDGLTFVHIDSRTWVVCFNRLNKVRRSIEGQSTQELQSIQGFTLPIPAKGMNIAPDWMVNRTGAEGVGEVFNE
jgi:hypothetical protein